MIQQVNTEASSQRLSALTQRWQWNPKPSAAAAAARCEHAFPTRCSWWQALPCRQPERRPEAVTETPENEASNTGEVCCFRCLSSETRHADGKTELHFHSPAGEGDLLSSRQKLHLFATGKQSGEWILEHKHVRWRQCSSNTTVPHLCPVCVYNSLTGGGFQIPPFPSLSSRRSAEELTSNSGFNYTGWNSYQV